MNREVVRRRVPPAASLSSPGRHRAHPVTDPGGGHVLDDAAAARLAPLLHSPSSTAILVDFDGTLAPIVEDPASARPLPEAETVLRELARRFKVVAVVSGRPLAFLTDRLPAADGVALVGLYGLERSGTVDGPDALVPGRASRRWRPVVVGVVDRLRAVLPAEVGVEEKGMTTAVHWRRRPDLAELARAAVAEEAARTGLVAHDGRMSVELRPPLGVDKGSTVTDLVRGCTAACFLGDDLGDLPAFDVLDALSASGAMDTVTVAARDRESAPEVLAAADLVVPGPAGALDVLAWLADRADRADRADQADGSPD